MGTIYPEMLSVSLTVAECGLCDNLAAADLQKNTNNRVKRKIQRHNKRTKKATIESNFPAVFGAVFGVTKVEFF